MSSPVALFVILIEIAFVVAGFALIWEWFFSAKARALIPVLPTWEISGTDFVFFLWFVVCGGFIGPFLLSLWLKHQAFDDNQRVIFSTAAFQAGMLTGVLLFRLTRGRRVPQSPVVTGRHWALSGISTYFVSLPVVFVVSLLWVGLLKLCNIPTPQQDAIDILRHTGHPVALLLLLACAIIVAPVTEELIFRAGIFRFARTRMPRWAALFFPACLFGAMHANLASFAPLAALGIVYSIAYERSGRIGTSIVAHALFNLTTTTLVMAGLDV
jgi:membrane protease YdiL (CAAX protease family)